MGNTEACLTLAVVGEGTGSRAGAGVSVGAQVSMGAMADTRSQSQPLPSAAEQHRQRATHLMQQAGCPAPSTRLQLQLLSGDAALATLITDDCGGELHTLTSSPTPQSNARAIVSISSRKQAQQLRAHAQ